MSHDIFGAYDTTLCTKAILNLWLSPETLTEAEIAQLTLLDAEFGDRARCAWRPLSEERRRGRTTGATNPGSRRAGPRHDRMFLAVALTFLKR